jgi:uncharacterized RDD family membrane protein YckC
MISINPTRLLALAALSWAMLGASAALAQTADTNSDQTQPGPHHEEWVSIGKDVELKAEDSSQDIVVIGGSAKIHGTVHGEVVVIGGHVEIDGHVSGDVVDIMGDAQVEETAKIDGELVCVGGESHMAKGGKVRGDIVEIGAGQGLPGFLRLAWLKVWVAQCVMKLRPLAPGVGWIWCVAGFFFIVYFLLAVLFPHPVRCCVARISAQPATTFAAGVLAKLAIPILCLILPITVVGIVVVPFLIIGAFLTVLVGKTAVLEYAGGRIGGGFGLGEDQRPLVSFLIGIVLLTLLYMVPVIGLLTFCIFSCWGLGAGVTAICVALRSNRPPPPVPAAAPPPVDPSVPMAPVLAPPQALAYPRAGFWERMAAGFLDIMLVTLSSAAVGPLFTLVGIAYFSGMWAWKGTTVGGIVLNLQVVRQDGKPLSFLTAFVRILAALFSAVVLFLGFFWIGWDRDKQGWHDKIAGTVVVRLPRAVSLVCY